MLFELKKLVIENTNNSGNELVLNIYPNPTTSIITVALGNIIRQNMQFELVDIFGQSVIKKYLENKIIKFDFNLEYLEDGLYFLKISEPLGLIHSGKIVKISVF
ncbi:MAG: T9SS type A sorting domain-containing protein [Saprospiraceae bacterium]|nr:T9SS type A sorting domain-containing protein [Saprospiraceae bacterium]